MHCTTLVLYETGYIHEVGTFQFSSLWDVTLGKVLQVSRLPKVYTIYMLYIYSILWHFFHIVLPTYQSLLLRISMLGMNFDAGNVPILMLEMNFSAYNVAYF